MIVLLGLLMPRTLNRVSGRSRGVSREEDSVAATPLFLSADLHPIGGIMDLYLRRENHPRAHDNYRVIVKEDGFGLIFSLITTLLAIVSVFIFIPLISEKSP
jgi:hypothetical protein